MKLPKLYRKVWLKIEWLKDECVNGEHEQTCGDIYIEAKRVKKPDNTWCWQVSNWDIEENRCTLEMAGYFDGDDEFMYDIELKNPNHSPYNEGDWCYAYQRLTIKEQIDQKSYIQELEDLPF